MMILQNLQYPEADESVKSMYYRYTDGKCYVDDKSCMRIERGCVVQFNTYFNSFSYGKWKKYTVLGDLHLRVYLKGSCEVSLIRLDLANEIVDECVLYRQKVSSCEMCEFDFEYPVTAEKGLVSFRIAAFEDSECQGGYYYSDIDVNSLPEVNLALCICTYKRENYINSNIEMLKTNVFSDKNSMLNRHLRVYIADNGQTLELNKFGADEIKIYPNINSGGAGGFSRAMIEAISDREKYGITHIILMDDDVVFTHYALERTYSFLRLLKTDCKNIMLGGAMLRLDLPFAQFANGETWSVGGICFNKINYNLCEPKYILQNEIEESINQLAWWFCCFPLDDNSKNNLALPIFFQYDDVDFNQRNSHLKKVTLNGICLWHETFEKKISASKEYYAMRNRLIVSAIHCGNEFTKKFVKKLIITQVVKNIMMYRYKAADLLLRAVEDFFRGFDWLTSINQEELNREITVMGYTLQPLDELPIGFVYDEYLKSLKYSETNVKRLFRLLTLNGWLLKSNRHLSIVSASSDNKANYYRVKRALNYDENSLKGFVVEKNHGEIWRVLRKLRSVLRLVHRKFNKTVESYSHNWQIYVTQEFWQMFLKL